jgi:hypothetical protein
LVTTSRAAFSQIQRLCNLSLPVSLVVAHISSILFTQDTCYPYLDGEKVYYLGDSEWFDDPRSKMAISLMTNIASVFDNVMKPGRVGVKVRARVRAGLGLE